jgi:hypothetical protein
LDFILAAEDAASPAAAAADEVLVVMLLVAGVGCVVVIVELFYLYCPTSSFVTTRMLLFEWNDKSFTGWSCGRMLLVLTAMRLLSVFA